MNELDKLLEFITPLNTGTSEAHEEFRANRVLSKEELQTLLYHDLQSWTKVAPNSPSQKLKDTLCHQLRTARPGIEKTQKPIGVDIDWIVQEYICAETEDYSFGVYEEPQQLRVRVKPGSPILPCLDDEAEMSESDKQRRLALCPRFDLTSESQDIERCLLDFFHYYTGAPEGTFNLTSELIDDVEGFMVGNEEEGWLFTSKSGEGGISDNGVMIAALIMFDFSNLTGISLVDKDESCTFECAETEFGNYYECKTIGDMAKILNDVKTRIRRDDENSN